MIFKKEKNMSKKRKLCIYEQYLNQSLRFTNKKAFTLAEVLITLGIIGIISALLIPQIVSKYTKQERSARLKKFNSVISNALLLSQNDNGDVKNWTMNPVPRKEDGTVDISQSSNYSIEFFNKYIAKYINYEKVKKYDNNASIDIFFYDGSKMSIYNGGCMDLPYDVNGEKKPNQLGLDTFYFFICPHRAPDVFSTVSEDYSKSREEALQDCKSNPIYCSTLLKMDNWEFKDDYPFKL